ncbi:dnaJ homolog subfamily B member 13-like [Vigna radiata var. radiata]|uniref:DnaJ homolog subfamily B member 13-like n=1 Tax=Vigna radiata var. radiata TaxID=3916 RepID=A0A1S3W187_VIGRR|nr:dnaJ homolog subfamily B member 13-like [Vigna radiata var. radiata]
MESAWSNDKIKVLKSRTSNENIPPMQIDSDERRGRYIQPSAMSPRFQPYAENINAGLPLSRYLFAGSPLSGKLLSDGVKTKEGGDLEYHRPTDLVLFVYEKLPRVYTRDVNDLVVTQKISLVEALIGCTVNLVTLDGRSLIMPIDQIIHPEYEEVVEREGMPLPKDPTKKGNLRIKFKITFPDDLTPDHKLEMQKLLSD